MNLLPQYKNKSCKVVIQEKDRIRNSSTTISTASLNKNYFKIFTSILLSCSFKTTKIYLTQKTFCKDLLRHGKDKSKKGNVRLL